jgi:hypothetical protein
MKNKPLLSRNLTVMDSRTDNYRTRCHHCILLNSGVLTEKSPPNTSTLLLGVEFKPTDALPYPSEPKPT